MELTNILNIINQKITFYKNIKVSKFDKKNFINVYL